jgi:uncharacterized protein YlzI (FlbEa/FlbD family)
MYLWGKGYVITQEAHDEVHTDISKLIKELGMFEVPDEMKVCSASAQSGVNDYEGLYFHPMDFSGCIHKDNIEKVTEIIRSFKSKYFSLSKVDVYTFRPDSLPFYVRKNKERFDKIYEQTFN